MLSLSWLLPSLFVIRPPRLHGHLGTVRDGHVAHRASPAPVDWVRCCVGTLKVPDVLYGDGRSARPGSPHSCPGLLQSGEVVVAGAAAVVAADVDGAGDGVHFLGQREREWVSG